MYFVRVIDTLCVTFMQCTDQVSCYNEVRFPYSQLTLAAFVLLPAFILFVV